ncbi:MULTISPECIES: sce7726 family protein [Enterobacteriaceae]|uniref:sce7726 family protein n=1 Tax=Enterobacteriaceae TaxID=543 RepID=UPI001AE6C7CC|nr:MULTISPECIES: sce7726 family protein [Enterobacteriaceae]MCO4804149.1 sce7726 family protein [Klebsiella aerogenes]QTP52389.1 sce7726 family protein [Escherichia coli]
MLNDSLIRTEFVRKHLKDRSIVFHELAVKRGIAIADIVTVNSFAHCYEIKSDVDSLSRLPTQVSSFSDVFKKVTLITTHKHVTKAQNIIPSWWGVIVARKEKEDVVFNYVRKSKNNPKDTSSDLLKILWNDELKSILSSKNIPFKKGFNRDELVNVIINNSSSKFINDMFFAIMNKRINQSHHK